MVTTGRSSCAVAAAISPEPREPNRRLLVHTPPAHLVRRAAFQRAACVAVACAAGSRVGWGYGGGVCFSCGLGVSWWVCLSQVFIGVKMDKEAITRMLDECLLRDEEMVSYVQHWGT
jgi:hypothetical protein